MCLFALRAGDIGIDLGTSNVLVATKDRGIILREPAVVAINIRTRKIVATGLEAKEMIGRTPEAIKALNPLKGGVIADFTATKLMLKNIFKKLNRRYNIKRPRVICSVPFGITEVEENAVKEAIVQAGGKEVYLIDAPLAGAIGVGMHIEEPTGKMITDIGGGITEVAIISLGSIVVSESIKTAGDEMDADIINYMKRIENLAIGETTAEELKMELGCAMPLIEEKSVEIRGRDLKTGLPKNVTVTSTQILEAMDDSINKIVNTIKLTLEKTPPELAADLIEKGIVLIGGGAKIKNMDQLISNIVKMPVYVAENALESVVNGTQKTLQELNKLKCASTNVRRYK